MVINGKERGMEFVVQSYDEISQLCPDHDIAKLGDLLNDSAKNVSAMIKCAIILNKAYEDHEHYKNHDYEPDYLSEDDFRFMSLDEMKEVSRAVADAFQQGMKTTVKTEQIKRKNAVRA